VASPGKAVSDGRLPSRPAGASRAHPAPATHALGRRLVAAGLTLALFVFVLTLYFVSLHQTVDTPPYSPSELNARDSLYFGIHAFFLFIAAATGFSLGKWVNGLGVAFAVLLVVSTATAMAGTQVATYELACRGHNDLVRHWEC